MRLAIATTLALAALAPGTTVAASDARPVATPVRYAALGDSYSAGNGAGGRSQAQCYRGASAWPRFVAAARGWELALHACSGATTADVLTSQLPALDPATDVVTITIGGNDLGFGTVMGACAGSDDALCAAVIAQATTALQDGLGPRLDTVYAVITGKAPNAALVVVGYPPLFAGTGINCGGTDFTASEQKALNTLGAELNATIRAHAQAAGARFVDPTGAFRGHAVCTQRPFITGVDSAAQPDDAFHPNAAGQLTYARVALLASRLLPRTRPAADPDH